jgi:hypothetical protein
MHGADDQTDARQCASFYCFFYKIYLSLKRNKYGTLFCYFVTLYCSKLYIKIAKGSVGRKTCILFF